MVDFDRAFEVLTGAPPLSWQKRLFREHFAQNKIPDVIDLPTGLGKTMVMAIWLIARAMNGNFPTRLIYVVDRRTVVDQATDLAEDFAYLLAPHDPEEDARTTRRNPIVVERKQRYSKQLQELRQELNHGDDRLAISTLRGQLADNREWSRDPSRPAIIIGTVDLIGSALLFSGYRSSYKRRPLEAGLLGQDSLLVLDEAHLSKPFEKLLGSISDFQKSHGKPMRVIRMSATSGSANQSDVFQLDTNSESETFDLWSKLDEKGDEQNPIKKRFEAKKHLVITTVGEKKDLKNKLADIAVELAQGGGYVGKRIVVFVRKPDDAMAIAGNIRNHVVVSNDESGPKPRKVKSTPYAESVRVLTGTMRGLERDELVDEAVFEERWLNGDLESDDPANQTPVFLVSTSAGEVGFDLNADHLVGDEAPLDSWIQRLGRVNRRGNGDARVVLVQNIKQTDKNNDFDKACSATTKLLGDHLDGRDVGPKSLASFVRSLACKQPEQIEHATSPKPTIVALTDILLDAWSMTSIFTQMPGRPEVGPWLRGIAEWEPPQTTIAWRAELDLDGFGELGPTEVEEWFDIHRIRIHETLSVKSSDAAAWLKERWESLPKAKQDELAKRPVIVDRAGLEIVPLDEIVMRVSRKANTFDVFLRGAEVIVPASFGGIRRGVGLLDFSEPKPEANPKQKPLADEPSNSEGLSSSVDVADEYRRSDDRSRYREKVVKVEGEVAESAALIPGAAKPKGHLACYTLDLESDDEKTVRLVSYVPRRERPETGNEPQTLRKHVSNVRNVVDGIAFRLEISTAIIQAAQLAADWHDHGKARERWQRLLVLPKDFARPDEPMGKSGGEMKRDPRGYRHEFGSLRELTDAFSAGNLVDASGISVSQEVFDLAAHLIAVHHGRGRPHFPKGGFDPDCESHADEIHTEAIRRFTRLQRKYGWWHLTWLENLLRCADGLASANDKIDEAGGDQ